MKTPLSNPLKDSSHDKGWVSMWHGPKKDLPAGFAVCDGSNGTPDMGMLSSQLGVLFVKRVK